MTQYTRSHSQEKTEFQKACEAIRNCGYCQKMTYGLCKRHKGTVPN